MADSAACTLLKHCDGLHTYKHSFLVDARLRRYLIDRIKRSGLVLILQQMRLDGVRPDWSSLDIQVHWPAEGSDDHTVRIDTRIETLEEGS